MYNSWESEERCGERDMIPTHTCVCVWVWEGEMGWERKRGMKYHPTRTWSHSTQEGRVLTCGRETITSQVCVGLCTRCVHRWSRAKFEQSRVPVCWKTVCLPVCLGSAAPQAALGVLVWKHLRDTREEGGGEVKLHGASVWFSVTTCVLWAKFNSSKCCSVSTAGLCGLNAAERQNNVLV